MPKKGTLKKTLKFIIKTDTRQESILNHITARRTYAVRLYLEIINKEENHIFQTDKGINGRLDSLTITTRNRSEVKYDFKALTGLNTCDLQQCSRTAIELYKSYKTHHKKWTRRIENASQKVIMKFLLTIEFTSSGEIIGESNIEEIIKGFSKTIFWRKAKKNKPSPPLESNKYHPKKIPIHMRWKAQLLDYRISNNTLYVKINTLKPRQPITVELVTSDYHMKQLQNARIMGGRMYKDTKNKRWIFLLTINKKTPAHFQGRKVAILGVDLGIKTDASVVVLLENEGLSKEQFHFLKNSNFNREKYRLMQVRKSLQQRLSQCEGNQRTDVSKQLRNVQKKYGNLLNEYYHEVSREVANISQEYVFKKYDVHVAIGKLKGLNQAVRRGDGRGKRFRGRISQFPYFKLTELISYKCREIGVSNIWLIKESWTSKVCHKCESKKTTRPTQALFKCLNCGLEYNADANGAINIALKYWQRFTGSETNEIKLMFLHEKGSQQSTAEGTGSKIIPPTMNLLEVERIKTSTSIKGIGSGK